MIQPGDVVEAVMDGGRDRHGLPIQYPVTGRIYKVRSIYEMRYGLGCTLYGMNPRPYKGYLLFVLPESKFAKTGWYFRKAEADDEFKQMMSEIRRKVNAVR